MIALIILEIFIAGFMIFFIFEFWQVVFLGTAPFLSTEKEVVEAISKKLKISPGQNIYELGAGKATFLRELQKKYPKANYLGVEKNLIPYLSSRLTIEELNHKIKIVKKDLFKVDIHEADIIYCYLNPNTMAKIADKLEKECRPGTIVISYLFDIPNWEIKETIDLARGQVYFYEI